MLFFANVDVTIDVHGTFDLKCLAIVCDLDPILHEFKQIYTRYTFVTKFEIEW